MLGQRSVIAGVTAVIVIMTSASGVDALTTYHVSIATASVPNPLCGGDLVIDLLSSDPWTNRLTIKGFTHDGHMDTTEVAGGPIAGNLVFSSSSSDSTTIDDGYFVNRLTVPFDTLGTYVSFDMILTEAGSAQPLPQDQVAVYFRRTGSTSPEQTADPLGANALFALTATGDGGGLLEAFSPAVVQSGTTINVDLSYLCAGGGGGCPFVDARTANGWAQENSILGRSVTGELSLDRYRLKSVPAMNDGRVGVRLRENEAEFTALDEARLIAVDHAPDTRAFAIGNRLVLGQRVAASRVTRSDGVDITGSVDGSGGDFFWGEPGDTLLVDMTVTPGQGVLGAQAVQDGGGGGGMEIDPKEMEAPQTKARAALPMNAGDEAILCVSGVLIQKPDDMGGWRTVGKCYPRKYRDEAMFDSLGFGRVRLVFVGRHRLHWIGRVVEAAVQSAPQDVRLLSATHSRLGNVRTSVAQLGGTRTSLVPGDTLNLEFAATAIPQGQVRDWFLLTTGVYSSTPLLTNDGPPTPEGALPTRFALRQNQPNPFDRMTSIRFELPVEARVRLEIFDAQGRLVRALADGAYPAGFHRLEWDRRTDNRQALGAGVYLYRIQAGSFRDQKKMVLLGR
jgi:hypothetical protein